MTKAYMKDIRDVMYCSKGTRAFFERNGLDFSDFLKNGIDVEKLKATKDAMAYKVVERAKKRELEDGRQ